MIEAIKFWNEPNNLSHWDFTMDREWKEFTGMTRMAVETERELCPDISLVPGEISPIDPLFIRLMKGYGLMDLLVAVAIQGFPLDWNHWMINDCPAKVTEIEETAGLPVWTR